MKKSISGIYKFVIILVLQAYYVLLSAQTVKSEKLFEEACKTIEASFSKANIPGLAFVFVDKDSTYIKSWGFADNEIKSLVTSKTLFELGSTSKAFTALAILQMEEQGLIGLEDNVSKYIPWFKAFYKGKEMQITIKELLHHTSGIPTSSISKIPQGVSNNMLEITVRAINNINLRNLPGINYEYSTVNYDILGLIIEQISKVSFEEYLRKNIFQPLQMKYTSVETPANGFLAKGYKISYFAPREYHAPRFRGNAPAGYVISNAYDMGKWLKYQLEIDTNSFKNLIIKSHIPNLSVFPSGLSSYAFGWEVTPYGEPEIFHSGFNPNYTSFIGLYPNKKLGIAILANSNSLYTAYLGDIIMRKLNNEPIKDIPKPENGIDKIFSLLSIVLAIFIIGILVLFGWEVKGVFKGTRKFKAIGFRDVSKIVGGLLITVPLIFGIYLLPKALNDFSWEAVKIWTSSSFLYGCILFVAAVLGIWILNVISIVIPTKNTNLRSLPIMIILSIMSGIANMVIILILINAIGNKTNLSYLLYYFLMALVFYIGGRKIVQTKLLKISLSIVYEIRMRLVKKIFLSSFQKFEKIDNGRVYATLNQDTYTISNAANILISIVSYIITIIGVFIYLGTISLSATLLIIGVIVFVATIYFIISRRTNALFEQARDTADTFAGLIEGLVQGFKELSLSGSKKKEFTDEIDVTCTELTNKTGIARIKFVNAFLIGESMLIMVLGTISFVIPSLFPEISNSMLLGFVMIVLYLIGPINGVLGTIPEVMQMTVSWKRIKNFIDEIYPDLKLTDILKNTTKKVSVNSLSVKDLVFKYKNENEDT